MYTKQKSPQDYPVRYSEIIFDDSFNFVPEGVEGPVPR